MNNYIANSKKPLVYLTAAALSVSSGCRFNGDPASDLRFVNVDPKVSLVTTNEEDQKYTAEFLRDLNNRIHPFDQSKLDDNDGVAFVVYDARPKGVSRTTEPYDLETTVRILGEGIIKGEEVSGNHFRAYASADECMAAVRKEKEVFADNPAVVKKPDEKKMESKEKRLETEVTYDKSAPILVVDFNSQRVVGLYEVGELEKVWADPSKTLADANNMLNLKAYAHNKTLVKSVRKVLRTYLNEEDTDELLEKVGRTTGYLLDSEFDLKSVKAKVKQYNEEFTSSEKEFSRGLNDFGEVAKIRDVREKKSDRKKAYTTVFPKEFRLEHCVELYIDTKTEKPMLRVLEKPKE